MQRLKALTVLAGVGDAEAGEWWEDGDIATHLRRRLSDAEAQQVGPVMDVRHTDEAQRRLKAIWSYLPSEGARQFALKEASRA